MSLTHKIITKKQFNSMVDQLENLGALKDLECNNNGETVVYLKTPKGKEVFRAIVGRDGDIHARWIEGLFDARTS